LSEATPPSDRETAEESDRMHAQVGWVLRIGLTLAVLLLASGLLVLLATGADDAPAARLWHLDGGLGPALTTLGVMVLAFTPALRVLALVVVWWHERDWRFVGVALFVVATLAVGILLGRG
jgi:uncharacterized membrane protein